LGIASVTQKGTGRCHPSVQSPFLSLHCAACKLVLAADGQGWMVLEGAPVVSTSLAGGHRAPGMKLSWGLIAGHSYEKNRSGLFWQS